MSVKSFARSLAAHQAIGVPLASLLGRLGQAHRRARVLEFCGHMPGSVRVRIPARVLGGRARQFRMVRGAVTDQIAWRLWTEGWTGFEPPLPDLFAAACRDAGTVLDIGANSGLYALIAATVAPRARVVAFEPLPQALGYLRANVALNELAQRVRIVPEAVSDACGEADFYVPAGNEGLLEMSASLNPEFRPQHADVLKVPVTTIDGFVRAQALNDVSVLKIDVESQEHRVLAGAAALLQAQRPVVFLEVLPVADVAAIAAAVAGHDYRAMRLANGSVVEAPLGNDPDATNQVLCPAERLEWFLGLASGLGLKIERHDESSVAPPVGCTIRLPTGAARQPRRSP